MLTSSRPVIYHVVTLGQDVCHIITQPRKFRLLVRRHAGHFWRVGQCQDTRVGQTPMVSGPSYSTPASRCADTGTHAHLRLNISIDSWYEMQSTTGLGA